MTPTLDTQEYKVEWEDRHLSATTVNVIAESMYDMYNEDSNRILLFDTIVAHRRCLTANTHADQKFTDQHGKTQYK